MDYTENSVGLKYLNTAVLRLYFCINCVAVFQSNFREADLTLMHEFPEDISGVFVNGIK